MKLSSPPTISERASSVVEYIGLGALSLIVLSGIATAMDAGMGDRFARILIERLVSGIVGT